jgi:uncharacterized phage protein gp47/JayE
MSYTAPYIDATGLHIDTYYNLRDDIIEQAKSIYGQDIYLGNDSQDYQFIATISEYMYDVLQAVQLVYNNRGPSTAIGSGLDGVIKLNGIKRKAASYSTCPVIVSGIPGTQIRNGIILDKGSIKWDLPPIVTIPDSGQTTVTATCEIPGPIVANPSDLITIYNPAYGWNGVYNTESAELGSDVETDSLLRKRQSYSTAQPSRTMLEGTAGAVAQIADLTRSKVYENDTNLVDSRGLPPHSITVIAEGGTDSDIAQAIFAHKGLGCYTNGDITVDVTDSKGEITPIRFFRPTYVDIDITFNIKGLAGYTIDTVDNIKESFQAYLNSMDIGAELAVSSLWGIALQNMPDIRNPSFSITSITAGRHGQAQVTDEIRLAYNEVCRGNINYMTANPSPM